jgi:hypothetical protein
VSASDTGTPIRLEQMRELKIEIRDADPGYVNERFSPELYIHLRAVPSNVVLRRRALERAYHLYEEAAEDAEPRRGGLALLVLQRAMLAIEDFAGLLYALEEPPSFSRLVSYDLGDIGHLLDRLVQDRELVPRLYGMPTREAIAAELELDDAQRTAITRLCAATLAHVRQQLAAVHHFWVSLHFEAKKTMHGVGFIAGCYAVEPPGAGMITACVDVTRARPFAVALDTGVDHATRHVNTKVGVVDLTPAAVARMNADGHAACDAAELLAQGRLYGLQTMHAFALPAVYLDEVNEDDRNALAPMFKR